MFAALVSAPSPLPLLPPPVVGSLLPFFAGDRPTQVRPMSGGGLALVHLQNPSAPGLPLTELLDAWQWAEVTINLLEPLEGIPLVLLAAQAGHVPAVVGEIDLTHLSHAQASEWLREASTNSDPLVQLVLLEPVQGQSPQQAEVLCSRRLSVPSPAFWRPLCRVLAEQLELVDTGDEELVAMAADGVLQNAAAVATAVLAGGPVPTLVSSPAQQ